MAVDLGKLSLQDLAHRFLDATIDMWGVDRHKVDEVLGEVKCRGARKEFAEVLWSFRLDGKTGKRYAEVMDRFKAGETPGDALVPAILKAELSGSGLKQALSLWDDRVFRGGSGWDSLSQLFKDQVNRLAVFAHGPLSRFVDEHPIWAGIGLAGAVMGIGATIYYGSASVPGAIADLLFVTFLFTHWQVRKMGLAVLAPAPEKKSLDSRDPTRPLALIIRATSDWNGAIKLATTQVHDELDFSGEFDLLLFEAGNEKEVDLILQKVTGRYGRIHTLVLGGHGTATLLRLGDDALDRTHFISSGDFVRKKSFLSLSDRISVDSQVILLGCSNGEDGASDPSNLANTFARALPGTRIYSETGASFALYELAGDSLRPSVTPLPLDGISLSYLAYQRR